MIGPSSPEALDVKFSENSLRFFTYYVFVHYLTIMIYNNPLANEASQKLADNMLQYGQSHPNT